MIFHLFYRLQVYGIENLPKGAAIIAPNHSSYYDPPIIGASIKEKVHFIAKSQLFRFSSFGWFLKQLNANPINETAESFHSLKLTLQILKEGKKVVIFPEGERSFDTNLLEIKPGVSLIAFRGEAPIVPTYISGAGQAWPRKNFLPWPVGKITVTYGTPIYPKDFKDLPAKQAREEMTKQLTAALERLKKTAVK
ncbi:MAG: lysophospholipid acyltransferase family protein [Waddliaceae bacterium]